MKWNEPRTDYPVLSLPKLTQPIYPIEQAACQTHITISSITIKAWQEGPPSASPKDIHDTLLLLIQAFALLAKTVKESVKVTTKSHETDFVTEADQGIEMLFRIWIKKHLPHHKIIGEEGSKDTITQNDIVWYIDPIDGTSNYIETPVNQKPLVSMHFGSTYQGVPFISIVATPFHNNIYSSYTGGTSYNLPYQKLFTHNPKKRIGSEFSGKTIQNATFHHDLCKKLQAESAQYKSIGINLLALLEGHITAFYKSSTKLWDVMAPLVLLHHYRPDIVLECLFNLDEHPITPETIQTISPFSNSLQWITHLNRRHSVAYANSTMYCRAGTILAYPAKNPELKEAILHTIQKSQDICP